MRVPNISMYDTSRYQLGDLTERLSKTNQVISTLKRINSMADDPVGISQVLSLKTSVGNLEQLNKNIAMGKTWLEGCETSLQTVQDQLNRAKTLSSQMVNASTSPSERADAVEVVKGMIDQIMTLSNKQVNGSYIFSGVMNDVRSFTFDDNNNPSKVIYNGDTTPFAVKVGKESKLDVGKNGDKVFTEDIITIDSTNNKLVFREDTGEGAHSKVTLEAIVPDGKYNKEELSVIVRNVMNAASKERGYGIDYEVEYNNLDRKYTIRDAGKHDGYFRFDLLWESGETPRISQMKTYGVIKEGVNVNVIDDSVLKYSTPEPAGTSPLRLTYKGNGLWGVLNNPGYAIPTEIPGTENQVKLDLTGNGITDILVTSEAAVQNGGYIEFDIVSGSNDHSIGTDLGFKSGDVSSIPIVSDSEAVLKTFDHTNNVIDFQENVGAGLATYSASIPVGDYSDMNDLAAAIEDAMEVASGNNINYSVKYSTQTHRFTFDGTGTGLTQLNLLWNTGTNNALSAATELGYNNAADDAGALAYTGDNDVGLINIIAGTNDIINFKEIIGNSSSEETSELTAQIPAGQYTDINIFAAAVEEAMENVSAQKGNWVDYEVTYSNISHKFTIKEDGDYQDRKLKDLDILWGTGSDHGVNAASTMGFRDNDISLTIARSDEAKWGIFETLFDLKQALGKNDIDGISRAMTRIDTHYNSITSEIADIGMKHNRLGVREAVSSETQLSLTKRRSFIEEADVVKAIMDLQAAQTAYKASLSSTSKIINTSLMDYM